MATIVNSPQPTNSDNGWGFFMGVILLIIFAVVLIFYGLPYLGSLMQTPSALQVNVPSDINVK